MGRFAFAVKNYRIIKQAKIEPEGITLIYGANGNGKSSIIKALVSMLSNQHSEDNFQHGRDSYGVSARCGENQIVFTRNGDQSTLKFNDEAERGKLGRGPLFQVEPRFPLKRVDYEDSSFFPNIAFQNSVPIFDDISCTDLMSSLFSSVARLSERVNACKSDCTGLAKSRDASETNAEMLKKKVAESSRAVDVLLEENPNIESQYKELSVLAKKKETVDRFNVEYESLSSRCCDLEKRNLISLYKEALPMFPMLLRVQKAEGVINQLDTSKSSLERVQVELGEMGYSFGENVSGLISRVGSLFKFRKRLEDLQGEIVGLPRVSPDIVRRVGALCVRRNDRFTVRGAMSKVPVVSERVISGVGFLISLRSSMEKLSLELDEVSKSAGEALNSLKGVPCDRYLQGLCPMGM